METIQNSDNSNVQIQRLLVKEKEQTCWLVWIISQYPDYEIKRINKSYKMVSLKQGQRRVCKLEIIFENGEEFVSLLPIDRSLGEGLGEAQIRKEGKDTMIFLPYIN